MDLISPYYDVERIAREVAEGNHRGTVGGYWEEMGELQRRFLLRQGLTPSTVFVDIGCGCLRAGIHLIDVLEPNHYFGVDINEALLAAGYEKELEPAGLLEKLPRENLVCSADFEFSKFGVTFDVALGQSLFSHLPRDLVVRCLDNLAPKMNPGGRFFATFFLVPDDHPAGVPYEHPHGVVTFDDKDPYHHRFSSVVRLCEGSPWKPIMMGQWGHPQDQRMVLFSLRHEEEGESPGTTRMLTVSEADDLPAGADHFRAYVGPPRGYDFMSATQFALLFALGLRESHRVLDFGCGSLRLGRLLIPYLRSHSYFAIDPNRWLIEEAISRQIGSDILSIKLPSFSFNDDFECNVFKEQFEFVMAQSILTHCGADYFEKLTTSVAEVLAPNGKFLFSVLDSDGFFDSPIESGWVYPECVEYGALEVIRLCRKAGLHALKLPWYHPGGNAVWFVAARDKEDLPPVSQLWLLRGAMLFDPAHEASRQPRSR